VDGANTNIGNTVSSLQFGDQASTGEAIFSKRTTGGNQNGLDFVTNTISRMSITNAGNVGIGTSNPNVMGTSRALTISSTESYANATPVGLELKGSTQSGDAKIAQVSVLSAFDNSEATRIETRSSATHTTSGQLAFYTRNAGVSTVVSERMRIDDVGNVGIGISYPTTTLHVAGSARITGLVGPGTVTADALGNLSVSTITLASAWNVTGNTGNVDGTNFIGNIDDVPFNIRVNNQRAGRIENSTQNTFLGYQAGNANTGGQTNTFIGFIAGVSNNADGNTAIGSGAFVGNTSGSNNTATGLWALRNNTSSFNTANGAFAMQLNTAGTENAAFGIQALMFNTTGSDNTALGAYSLRSSTGNYNTALGAYSLYSNTGANNTSVGYNTLSSNTTGSNNTAIGYGANVAVGNLNNATAIGYNAVAGASNTMVLGGTGASAVKVGIGTSTPASPLHVTGAARLGLASSTNGTLIFNNSTNANTVTIQSGVTNAQSGGSYTLTLPLSNPPAANSSLIATDATGTLDWATPGTTGAGLPAGNFGQTLYNSGSSWAVTSNLYSDNSKVNIGSPAWSGDLLNVGGTTLFENTGASSGTDFTVFEIRRYNMHRWALSEGANSGLQFKQIYNDVGTAVNSIRLEIGDNGNVGIGTSGTINNKLEVEGNATIGATYSGSSTAPSNGLLIEGQTGIGFSSAASMSAKLDVNNSALTYLTYANAIQGVVNGSSSIAASSIRGTMGVAFGASNNNYGIGLYGASQGPAINNFAVYGDASGGTNNYAGYFNGGNVYIANNLGIGVTSPGYPLHVSGNTVNYLAYLDNNTTATGYGLRSEVVTTATGAGNRYGVYAASWYGQSQSYGVYGYGYGGSGSYGVYGNAGGATVNYAGYFAGDVHVSGTLSKAAGSFKIDDPRDPENKYLSHSFVESPDMMNVYNGNITTDENGTATVTLPSYFSMLNKDFKYQLTVMGENFAQAIVYKKIEDGIFIIKTNIPNIEVSWQVTGVRKDPYAIKHPIIVEQDKPDVEKGTYLNPDVFGQPKSKSVGYDKDNDPENKERKSAKGEKSEGPDGKKVMMDNKVKH